MENRRELNIRNRIRKLRNAIKPLRYTKVDKEKLRQYFIALLVLKYRNDPTKLKYDTEEVHKVFFKKTT